MDIRNLTLGEIATVERISGRAFADIADENAPKGELLSALAFVIKKRTDETYTYEQAQKLRMEDIETMFEDESDEKKE